METITDTRQKVKNFNKPAYIIFVLIGIFFVKKDFSQASVYFGLALIFDPFNINMPFNKRHFYQKIWLIAHLMITLFLIVFAILK